MISEKFSSIIYNQDEHLYTLNSKKLISVTSLIEKFKPPFDRDQISKAYALKHGTEQRFVLDEWKVKKEYSTARGTDFHLYAMQYLNGRKYNIVTNIEHKILQFKLFWDSFKENYELIGTELIIGDSDYGVAGTVDCLVRHKQTGLYSILDWKTCAEIEYVSTYMMKYPIKNLPNTNFIHYSLQLCIYKKIHERNLSFKFDDCYIVHFSDNKPFSLIKTMKIDTECDYILLYRNKYA